MATINVIAILSNYLLSKPAFEPLEIMLIFGYIAFGMLTELKETARQQ